MQPPQDVETPPSRASPEHDGYSSYGTGESEQELPLDALTTNRSDALTEGLDELKSYIAAPFASLEKVVRGVQEDMTGVRTDVGVLHEMMDRMSDYVGNLTKTVADVDGLHVYRSPDPPAWGWSKDEAHAKEGERADMMALAESEGIMELGQERSIIHAGHDADSAIQETQMFGNSACMYTNITSLSEVGGEPGWEEVDPECREHSSPSGQQPEKDVGFDGMAQDGTQLDLTPVPMQTGTQAPGPSFWSQFASAVNSMEAPARDTWVPCKRGRENEVETGARQYAKTMAGETPVHEEFNLNVSPQRLHTGASMRGRGRNAAISARGAGRRGGARGGGRGTGRVKKPPTIQPRYRSTASARTTLLEILLS